MIPGVGRAVWQSGASGGGTGRTAAWNTYDGTEDTAWQQMVDDTSTALTSYSVTRTEKNIQPGGNEKAYIALTNGTSEYLGVIAVDAIDPTSAHITTYGPYTMERCELNRSGQYLMLSSLENDGSINIFKDGGTTITETGVMTNATLGLRDPGAGERTCSLIWSQTMQDDSYNVDYNTAAPVGHFIMLGGRSTVTNNIFGEPSTRIPSNWPGISVWGTYDIDSVITAPPSDSDLLTSWNEGVDDTGTVGTPDGIFKVSGWSGGAWYSFQSDGPEGGLNGHFPTESFHPNYPSSPSSPSSDRVFAGWDGSSSYYTDQSSVIRPFLAKRSQDLAADLAANPSYNWFRDQTYTQTQQLWVDWRSIRQGSADQIAVGWTTYETKAGQLGYEKGSGNPNWDVAAYIDPSDFIGSLDDPNDGVYPNQETKLGIINNDRVMFRSNSGRSTAELGEDFVQAIQIGTNMWVGMYPDTTGTNGGNLWLNATSITTEDLATAKYNIEPANVLTSTEDITAEESHSQYSIPVSVVNGSDSTSTAFDPDAATIFALDDPYFAVLWRKSTTAYISIFKITNRAASSLPPLLERVVDAQSLGTVSASDVSGVKMGRGVAMITCGDKYRFIKVPV